MRLHRHPLALALLLATLTPAIARAATQDETAIRGVLNTQVEAWNRGDVVAFMQGYNNSPDTTFVGKTVEHGFANILARYQRNFAGKEKMGHLAFDDLEVHPLDAHIAVVTGRYHLTRSANGGGDAQGIFSLVFEKTSTGWKIVLDHTS
ncbi:MAG TPA: nuclear transport factor 2 family protein [Acidobacteriaceae bacterium]